VTPASLVPLFALSIALSGGCASSPAPEPSSPSPHSRPAEHEGERRHHEHRFDDPARFVPAWNAPDRDAWQKPGEIVAAMRVEPGATVVDLGAGTGYLIPSLAEAVGPTGTVLAADVEPAMLEYLEKAATNEGWSTVRTHAMDGDDPGLAPESVDSVVTLNVWHHVSDRVDFAKKLHAALKPGGTFVVVDFLKEKTEGFGPPMWMRLTAEEVMRDLAEGGFSTAIVEETLPRHYIVRGTKRPVRSD
jgi:predicted methyltransferase